MITLNGTVIHGQHKGTGAGFPTANLAVEAGETLPKPGVYASCATVNGKKRPGVTNIGTRPTADCSAAVTVETWLFDFEEDIYGLPMELSLYGFIRGIRPFESMAALKRQIDADRVTALEMLGFPWYEELTASAVETAALGMRLAKRLCAGDVVVLHGDLGAGKSELARGIARGLGVSEPVPSPSFTILNAYLSGRLPLYHFDWYRIQDAEELEAIGAEEQINGNGVSLIEWAERAPELLPDGFLLVSIEKLSETERRITVKSAGSFRSFDLFELKEASAC